MTQAVNVGGGKVFRAPPSYAAGAVDDRADVRQRVTQCIAIIEVNRRRLAAWLQAIEIGRVGPDQGADPIAIGQQPLSAAAGR